MAFYSEDEDAPDKRRQLRQELLVSAEHSLLNQSQANRLPFHNFMDEDDFVTRHRIKGNHDGWGLIASQRGSSGRGQSWQEARSTQAAYAPATESEPGFTDTVDKTLKKVPRIIMGHVRAASSECKQVSRENTHPFIRGNWAFMHNGFVDGALSKGIQKQVHGKYKNLLGFEPSGTTDSEAAFHLFLGKLKEAHGTLDSSAIGLEKVQRIFAESIRELVNESRGISTTLHGRLHGITGKLSTPPIMNFVVSDGENLLAFRKGLKLYLGLYALPDGGQECIISSEAVNPGASASKIDWMEIPQETLLTLRRKEDGTVEKSLYSLDELVPQTPLSRLSNGLHGFTESLAHSWRALTAWNKPSQTG